MPPRRLVQPSTEVGRRTANDARAQRAARRAAVQELGSTAPPSSMHAPESSETQPEPGTTRPATRTQAPEVVSDGDSDLSDSSLSTLSGAGDISTITEAARANELVAPEAVSDTVDLSHPTQNVPAFVQETSLTAQELVEFEEAFVDYSGQAGESLEAQNASDLSHGGLVQANQAIPHVEVRNKSSTEVQTSAQLVQTVAVADIVWWARMGSLKNYRHARKRVANLYTLRHDLQRANSLTEAEMQMLAALSALCGSERLPTVQDLASLEPEAGILEATTARARTLEAQVRAMMKSRGLEGHLITHFELML
ncbi:hypothetical protein FKP32DRAFT_1676006 [Trametes sanguinea]|nr:hypothetical protein FKP32DRAFT_1676006 [Trametes sanguinea]